MSETLIPYLTCPGWPHPVYRYLLDEVHLRDEHQERYPGWTDENTCLCHKKPDSWQRGDPLANIESAPVWAPNAIHGVTP